VSDADHVQLARLITEISWRIDHGRAATVHELFVDDGEMSLGPKQVLQGRDAIREWGLQIERAAWRIRHVSTNMRFVSEGDGVASGISLVTAYMAEGEEPGTTLPWAVGEDHDQFVRTSEGWRLRSRRWEPLFMRPEPGRERDRRAVAGQRGGGRSPDPARRAGDERDRAGQCSCHHASGGQR
jgi:SnoaL-like domain